MVGPFGASDKIGKIQRRLAWPLRKDESVLIITILSVISRTYTYHTKFGGNSAKISAKILAEWVAGGMGGWLGRKTWLFF